MQRLGAKITVPQSWISREQGKILPYFGSRLSSSWTRLVLAQIQKWVYV